MIKCITKSRQMNKNFTMYANLEMYQYKPSWQNVLYHLCGQNETSKFSSYFKTNSCISLLDELNR